MKLKGSCHCRAVQFEVESATPYPFMRCYCSICRKTAGGGGYAINIMGQAKTLKVKGMGYVSIYRAKIKNEETGRYETSTGERHFCKHCASYLWISDPEWPELVHPFASAMDTDLPKPPEEVHILLDSVAKWVEVPSGKHAVHFSHYPKESIEEWHKRHKLYEKLE